MNWIIITVALLGLWLDICFAQCAAASIGPIILWAGIVYFIQKDMAYERWLWIIAYATWGLFILSWIQVMQLAIIFGTSGELLNYLCKRFIPRENYYLRCIIAMAFLIIATIIYSVFCMDYFGYSLIVLFIIGFVVLSIIIKYVRQQKET